MRIFNNPTKNVVLPIKIVEREADVYIMFAEREVDVYIMFQLFVKIAGNIFHLDVHYVCHIILVQRFEPQSRHFTNFH